MRGRLIVGAVVMVAVLAPAASAQVVLPPPDAPPGPAVLPSTPPAPQPSTPAPTPAPPSSAARSPAAPSPAIPAPRTAPRSSRASAIERLEADLARAQQRARAAARRRAAAIRREREGVEREERARARAELLGEGDGAEALPRTVSSIGVFSVMLLILGALALVGLPLALDRLGARAPSMTRTLERGGVRLTLQAASLAIASAVVYAVIVLL
jgi:hypothetical protein